MKIIQMELHNRAAMNVQLFLETLGYKSVWNFITEDFSRLSILGDNDFLRKVKKEAEKTGFCPYHLVISESGKPCFKVNGEKIDFRGQIVSIYEFENISAPFRLITYVDSKGLVWLWKYYGLREFDVSRELAVTGKFVATLEGRDGVINLINDVRMK